MSRSYHIRYTIGFYNTSDETSQVYDDFRDIIENNYYGNYTLDATFYIRFSKGIIFLEILINKIFDRVLKQNNLTRRECYFKYDICKEATPPDRRINLLGQYFI